MNIYVIIGIVILVAVLAAVPDLRDRLAPILVIGGLIAAVWFLRSYLIIIIPVLVVLVILIVYLIDRAQKKRMAAEKQQKEAAYLDEVKAMGLDEQAEELLIKGYEYVSSIAQYNEKIPDDEMSGKLEKLENTTRNIFDEVKKHPEKAKRLNKVMEFYLPMTDKILKQYAEYDENQTTGENVTQSKKTVNETMDSVNEAFESILDNLYLDDNIDITSDAAVLKQMFTSDGLIKNQDMRGDTK